MNIPSTTVSPYVWPQRTTTPPPVQPAAGVNPAVSPPAPQPLTPSAAVPGQADTFEASPGQSQFQPTFGAGAGTPDTTTDTTNVFAGAATQQGNWAIDTVPVKQSTDVDCGAATATMLSNAKSPVSDAAQVNKMNDLQKQFGTDKGTTPEQMKQMLAHEGIETRRTDASLDNDALAGTLSQGGKTVAMVDSNTIRPGGSDKPGDAHWVVVDGMNKEGDYRVRDPSDGSSYYVSKDKLGTAMDTARAEHGSGGMMFVESAKADESTLNQVGPDGTIIGNDPGTGSRGLRNTGESSGDS